MYCLFRVRAKRPSQDDVAKAVGVSRAAVSLALRGGGGLAARTKAKIIAAADRLGYRPNSLVAGIKSGKTRTVGLFVHPYDSYWGDIINGISDRLAEAEHAGVLLLDRTQAMGMDHDYAMRQVHRALDQWCDAVILWPYFANLYAGHVEEFASRNIPVVTIDHILPDRFAADAALTEEMRIAELSLGHLFSLGHRHILMVVGPERAGWANDRLAAMEACLATEPELRSGIERIAEDEQAAPRVAHYLRSHNDCSAVLGFTDHYAAEAYKAAEGLGLRIPEDLSVVGVADLNFAQLLSPALTTVKQSGYETGRAAAQMALERSVGLLQGAPKHVRIPPALVVRKSTAKLALNARAELAQ